ncbi:patatin-like phospholipase family protein [Pseudogulbenkiania sp. MAI-1]|uniref:patatin-like phospholipase family protein n=1 Tax=Pseudogulbenkiania sp. MAI-1 TaxID=990370 RepID=UPI00045E6D6F|nr:patatin-like phospholipase family protein [Pseudogulbenkiania sp. MAI-1]
MKTTDIALALQGGGAHGAFTWGVLDRLLETRRFRPTALSGASAGALNAALLTHGFMQDGYDGAREALSRFWHQLSALYPWPAAHTPPAALHGLLFLSRVLTSDQLNPFDYNPLRELIDASIDFTRLRSSRIQLFIAATHVNSGRLKLFHTHELSTEHLLASACLPQLHHTVHIDGEAYWDGGLTANPPLFPLAYQGQASDIVLVTLVPQRWEETPDSAGHVDRRLNDISFGSSLHTELQGLAIAKREADKSLLSLGRLERHLRRLRLHHIDADATTGQLDSLSKLTPHHGLVQELFAAGRERAQAWLEDHGEAVGQKSTMRLLRRIH